MFCRKCGKEFDGKFCPNCGEPAILANEAEQTAPILNGVNLNGEAIEAPKKEPFYSQTWFIVLMMFCCCFPVGLFLMWKYNKFNKPVRIIITIFFAICFIVGITNSTNTSNKDIDIDIVTAIESSLSSSAEATTKSFPAETESTIEETETTVADNTPVEYKSALKKAQIYSEMMYMSKQGIYNQLTSEYGDKFSTEAAQYAVDNMVADWNANALEKAKVYSNTMYMSKAGIYDQLVSEYGELFTEEEAQYAVDNIDADWKANALEKAKTYQNSMSMSPAAIHDQLTSEYGEKFTQEEADYAIDNLN